MRDPEGHLWGFGTYRMTDAVDRPNMSPTLWYADAPGALGWLERAFGFEKLVVIPGDNASVTHAELRFGPGVVMLPPPSRRMWRRWVMHGRRCVS